MHNLIIALVFIAFGPSAARASGAPIEREIICLDPWYTLLREGIKPVEGRKGTEKYKNIKKDQVITFVNGEESFRAKVKEVNWYPTLTEYLEKETLARTLPGVVSLEEGERIYLQWSTPEQIAEHGFVGIEVVPIRTSETVVEM